jgi:hypothetical protein
MQLGGELVNPAVRQQAEGKPAVSGLAENASLLPDIIQSIQTHVRRDFLLQCFCLIVNF